MPKRLSLKRERGPLEKVLTSITGAPFIIVFASELPLSSHATTFGFAGSDFASHPDIREALERRGFVGSSVNVALVNDHFFGRPFTPRQRQLFAGCALHEAAHYAVWDRLPFIQPLTPERANVVASRLQAESTEWPDAKTSPAWVEHGADFIRACFHIGSRMQRNGYSIDWFSMMSWGHLGYTFNALDYGEQLCDDIKSGLGKPLREVLLTAPPVGFLRLWLEDIGLEAERRTGTKLTFAMRDI